MIVKPKDLERLVRLLKEKPLILYGAGMRIAEWCDSREIQNCFVDRDFADKQPAYQKCSRYGKI